MGFSAVVFDLDGVLLDSNSTWEAVMSELFALAGKSFRDLDPGTFLGGDNSLQWADFLRTRLELPMTDEEIVDWVVSRIVSRYEEHLPLIPGAVETVAWAAARGPIGLASSSPRKVIETVLMRSGMDRFFRVWVSSDDVDCGKPAPDVYLLCADLLHLPPQDCVAVEDSGVGIRAARAAGFKVVALPNQVL
jgi:HAD superfamily hydrolase (TIGR01509 family)